MDPTKRLTPEDSIMASGNGHGPGIASIRRPRSEYGSKVGVSSLPSLPSTLHSEDNEDIREEYKRERHQESTPENSFVEFDFSSLQNKNRSSPDITTVSQRIIGSHVPTSPEIKITSEPKNEIILKTKDDDDDFFSMKTSNWKTMKTITELDYYDEKGELEFASQPNFDSLNNRSGIQGYTKIDTEEQVAKYFELDKKTDFLFRRGDSEKDKEEAAYRKEDLDYVSEEEDSDYDEDDNLDSDERLQATKNMLTESQKFAYVGISKLIAVDMATDLAKIKRSTSNKVAKPLSLGQRNFSNWTMYIMTKLYDHLDLTAEEKKMIENLSIHGLEVEDLSRSLISLENEKDLNLMAEKYPGFDLQWVIICDLFLLLLSDGYYDSRSNTLLVKFANTLGISELEILQFQRRLIESLEMESKAKSIENKDELLNDRLFIDKHIKKNRRKRLAFIGLATLGGSLAIGLSAGLLAPVIGAGLAAGLTTVGISGTSGFLAGVGGSAIITTGGVFAGAKVGSKAGASRIGDVHTFELKPLHNNKRPNLIITVSGWMNGKLDDVRLPFSTVDPVMGDMFSLLWEPEMLQSMGQTINILASEALTTSIQQILGATILAALMSAIQLPMVLSKLSYLLDNPWNVSLDRAWKAGKILADTLISGNMGVRPITLVGFSLGARLIYSCLIELAKRGGYGLIENVILLGNPITVKPDQLALARSAVSGRFVNGYSKKDWILGYLFRATGGGISDVGGLAPIICVDNIENIDCTDMVEGHMSYRKAIPKILKAIAWEVLSEEFAEIEEPDPEQGERTRNLISEFDEARAKMKEEQINEEKNKKRTWKDWFKPKQKDWWEIYESEKAEEAKPAQSSSQSYEYDENVETSERNGDIETNGPIHRNEAIFDVDGLTNEINEIEHIADTKDLQKVRKDLDTRNPQLRLNEDTEDHEQPSLVGAIASKLNPMNGSKNNSDK
jgi:hypothetical protein